MGKWFWIILCYSFGGYLLERLFAVATKAPKQVRKCCLLLPLCPVYGLAMALHLALLPREYSIWELMLRGMAVTTAVEYGVHLFYERVAGVRFWDYTAVRGNLNGRICLPFSAAWGVLSAGAVVWLQPAVERAVGRIPPEVTFVMLLTVTVDLCLSLRLLRCSGDTELLSWQAVVRRFG